MWRRQFIERANRTKEVDSVSTITCHRQHSPPPMGANFGRETCVHGCRHRIWGGAGTCMETGQGDSAHYVCSCDDGYSSNDSLGNPSCVRKTALLTIQMTVRPRKLSVGSWSDDDPCANNNLQDMPLLHVVCTPRFSACLR